MNVNILNLSRQTTEEELIELFKAYGSVELCDIVMDRQTNTSKGFGFIEMSSDEEAAAAIKGMHGKNVGGNKIKVKSPNKTAEEANK